MELFTHWIGSIPDFAVPYALAALGLILAERSGVLSLGAEGLMLVGALAAIGAQLAFGATGVSLVLAMAAASLVSVLFAVLVVWLRINQVIAGLALVFFCQGQRRGRLCCLAAATSASWRFTSSAASSCEPAGRK